ncbi:unnamed protein product [Amoebophrya sp. A25]|nr:unnamed protein product [Amoebophrya sp. A25]|eukprot:GSA25T00019058001.1
MWRLGTVFLSIGSVASLSLRRAQPSQKTTSASSSETQSSRQLELYRKQQKVYWKIRNGCLDLYMPSASPEVKTGLARRVLATLDHRSTSSTPARPSSWGTTYDNSVRSKVANIFFRSGQEFLSPEDVAESCLAFTCTTRLVAPWLSDSNKGADIDDILMSLTTDSIERQVRWRREEWRIRQEMKAECEREEREREQLERKREEQRLEDRKVGGFHAKIAKKWEGSSSDGMIRLVARMMNSGKDENETKKTDDGTDLVDSLPLRIRP